MYTAGQASRRKYSSTANACPESSNCAYNWGFHRFGVLREQSIIKWLKGPLAVPGNTQFITGCISNFGAHHFINAIIENPPHFTSKSQPQPPARQGLVTQGGCSSRASQQHGRDGRSNFAAAALPGLALGWGYSKSCGDFPSGWNLDNL